MNQQKTYPIVLSIAGSDSSGGAGIQADLKTFSSLGVYGATAITAITAQNTQGVHTQFALPPQLVYDQIIAVINDLRPSFIKIGMLANADIVLAVTEALSLYSIPIILDPVIVSTSGHRLLSVDAQEIIKEKLLPLSTLITPNIPEAEILSSRTITGQDQFPQVATLLSHNNTTSVLLKAGHLNGDTLTDYFYNAEDGSITPLPSKRVDTRNTHGTGCTLSSALAAALARGENLTESALSAKRYIEQAIIAGAKYDIGHGHGPVNHFFALNS